MTLGMAERQSDLLDEVSRFCEQTLPRSSVYAVLHRERDRLFPMRCSRTCSALVAAGRCRRRWSRR